jgi:predicted nucleic acid-binding protein
VAVLVDSNVILDVFTEIEPWFSWSSAALAEAASHSRLIINPIIYGEVSVHFTDIADYDDALSASDFAREALPYDAAFLAGKAYLAYRERGGSRRSPLPDFFIGAHALVRGYTLLTRDAPRYRTYFPRLELVAPSSTDSAR